MSWLLTILMLTWSPHSPGATAPSFELSRLQKRYSSGRVQSNFTQDLYQKSLGTHKITTGSLAWASPAKLRWETTGSSPSIIFYQNKLATIYHPGTTEHPRGRRTDIVVDEKSWTLSWFQLLFTPQKLPTQFKLQAQTQAPGFVVTLIPKQAQEVEKITLKLAPDYKIQKITLNYQSGNIVIITLTNQIIGGSLAESLFTPPIKP